MAAFLPYGNPAVFGQSKGEVFTYENHKYKVTGDNLITNGSFEDGLTGWKSGEGSDLTADKFEIVEGEAPDGNKYLKPLKNEGINEAGSIGTAWSIDPGKTYVYSYHLKIQTLPFNTQYLKTSLTNTEGKEPGEGENESGFLPQPSVNTGGEWTLYRNVFINTGNYAYIQARFRWLYSEENKNELDFDNFVLAEVTEIPNTDALDSLIAECQKLIDGSLADAPKTKAKLSEVVGTAETFKNSENVEDVQAQVEILTREKHYAELKLYDATSEKPVETDFVVNGTFDTDTTGWATHLHADGYNHGLASNQSGDITEKFFETWKNESYVGDISQSIENLPNGTYVLKAATFRDQIIDNSLHGDAVYLFADDDKTLVTSPTGHYYYVVTDVEDGTLTFGVKSEKECYKWMGIDNVTLSYYGTEADKAALATGYAQTEWDVVKAEGEKEKETYASVGGKWKTAFDDCLTATPSDFASYEEYRGKLVAALGNLAIVKPRYELVNTCDTVGKYSTASEEVGKKFNTAVSTAKEAFDAATTPAGIDDAYAALETAYHEYILAAAPAEGHPFDYDFLVEDAGNSATGWTSDFQGATGGDSGKGNFQYQDKDNKDNPERRLYKKGYVEAWSDGEFTGAMTRELTGLPNGRYRISAYAFTSKGGKTSFIAIANDTLEAPLDSTTDLYTQPVIPSVLVDENKMTVGLRADSATTWMGITHIGLQYLAAISDDDTEAVERLKETLGAKIEEAKAALGENWEQNPNVGDEAFQIPTDAAKTLDASIKEAEGIKEKGDAKATEVNEEITKLEAAVQTFNDTPLNAPKEGELFCIVNATEGFAYKDKAVVQTPNEEEQYGGYTLKWGHEQDANYAQAFTFTPIPEQKNMYKVSFIGADGTGSLYLTTRQLGYETGDNLGIRAIEDAEKALQIRVDLQTGKTGVYKLWNSAAEQNIGSNGDEGFYTNKDSADVKLVKAEMATYTLEATADGWATLILPFNVDAIPEGLTVYTCTGVDETKDTVQTEEATAIKANTPYLVYAEKVPVEFPSGYGKATQGTYPGEVLTGVIEKTHAPKDAYVLQKPDSGKAGFYRVQNDNEIEIEANKAYLNSGIVPNLVNAVFFPRRGNGETRVDGVTGDEAVVNVYDLSGILIRRNVKSGDALRGLQKGVYIVDGTKKAVK